MPKKRRPGARPRPQKPATCPCDLRRPYAACCGPLHAGERAAADAVELMRSRYSAFCLGEADYLFRTLHSQHEARGVGLEAYRAGMARRRGGLRYRGLRILDQRPPDAQGVAQVLFLAELSQLGREHAVVELSSFVREDDEWRYITGVTRQRAELSHGVEDLTIEHWDCRHHHHH